MSRFQVQLDEYDDGIFYCTSPSHKSFHDSPDIMEKVTASLAVFGIVCCIVVITVSYVKIVLLLRRRIAVPSTQRQPKCATTTSTAEHNPAPFDGKSDDSKRWDGIYELCELKDVADVNDIEPVVRDNQKDNHSTSCLQVDRRTQTSSQSASPSTQDLMLPEKASAMILPQHRTNLSPKTSTSAATTSKALSLPQAVQTTPESAVLTAVTDMFYPNTSLTACQLPGAVFGDDENVSTLNSASIRPRQMSSAGNEEVAIPTLEDGNNHRHGLQMITKTTVMLFTATVMCIITYGFVGIFVMLSESSKAGDFVLEFLLIIHVINPYVYNFVNKGFRDECKDVFKTIKFKCVIQRESSLAADHQRPQ